MVNDKIFRKEKLIEAREARGYSQTSLATETNVSRTSIASIERGKQIPRTGLLVELSNTLNFPVEFFYKQDNVSGSNIFFRSLSSATKSDRSQLTYRLKWLKEIILYLENYFEFPEYNLHSSIITKSDLLEYSNEDIENIAYGLRKSWNIGMGPINNLVESAERNGIIIARGKSGTRKIDAFSTYDKILRHPIIHLAEDKKNYFRSRFDLAHEIGHIVLHSNLDKNIINTSTIKLIEKQADYFAGAFLLPEQFFTNTFHYASLDEFQRLKNKWKTSIAALIMRACQLNLISDRTKRNLMISISKRGWRTHGEPLDNLFDVEQPSYLSKCVEIMIEQEIKQPEEILLDLSLSEPDVENLTNSLAGTFASKKQIISPVLKQVYAPKIFNLPKN